MSEIADLAGAYIGRARVREGMEESLAPVERKRFLKNTEQVPLELRADGSFTHKGVIVGAFSVKGGSVTFRPDSFNGQTLAQMRATAEEMGRAFGLSWLFDAFELAVEGEALVTPDRKSTIYMEYTRV